MSTYAIGDIQGCREQFEALLEHIRFDSAADTLWLAGDLVNRGPDSLGTLRLIHSIKDSVIAVLGNHDLHALAASTDRNFANRKDTFFSLLDAPDADVLLGWLRFRPLVHTEGDYFMSHAGVHPYWDLHLTAALAVEVEEVLRSEQHLEFFQHMYGNFPEKWSQKLVGYDRLRFITNALTRMRYCYADGSLDMKCKVPIVEAPRNLIPWFKIPDRITHSGYILHGHWAALMGGEPLPGIISLDTGCSWGGTLSAWCMEEKQWYSVPGIN
ncbi:MAG: symmetrical bis(5'-nucleosyl)-tetraphosphatase [Gammaproteobacteria bacterium]|nr:symmetrical bis(5'-nucleosyl)-tetraphosphatase [Gammaproteobacteria bacterium]